MINDNPHGLSSAKMKFCYEFMVDRNHRQAAIRAGVSERQATKKGLQWLGEEDVVSTIIFLQDERSKRTNVTIDKTVLELNKIASMNAGDYIDDIVSVTGVDTQGRATFSRRVTFKEFSDMTSDVKSCIQSVKESRDGLELKFYNKLDALDKLMRHLGGYDDSLRVNGDHDITYRWEEQDEPERPDGTDSSDDVDSIDSAGDDLDLADLL